MLDIQKLSILKHHGIDTISLSLSALEGYTNWEYNGTPEKLRFNLIKFVQNVKALNLNLRLCLNLTDFYNTWEYDRIIHIAKTVFLADQVTFQELYVSGKGTAQDKWIEEHKASNGTIAHIHTRMEIEDSHSIHYNNHCQGEKFILRPNCKLYLDWVDKGSLVY